MIAVKYYKENNKAPVLNWLKKLDEEAKKECLAVIMILQEKAHKIRMPHSKVLGDGLNELRIQHMKNRYRIIYFFDGKDAVILNHGFIKKSNKLPKKDLDIAKKRMKSYRKNPSKHIYEE